MESKQDMYDLLGIYKSEIDTTDDLDGYQDHFNTNNNPCTTEEQLMATCASPRDSFLIARQLLNQTNGNLIGKHDFAAVLQNIVEKPTKSIAWTFSSKLNKVFCQADTDVPFHFHYNASVPDGSYIKASVASKHDNHVIQTCPCHLEKEGFHFMKCRNPNTFYSQCPMTGRYFMTFPTGRFEVGVDKQTEFFTFSCFSSCLGIRKRELQIIFSLENNGIVLGRSMIDVKVCACPGRDRPASERKKRRMSAGSSNKSSSESDKRKKKRKKVTDQSTKINHIHETDSQEGDYHVAAKHKDDYLLLKNISEVFMQRRNIPKNEMPTMGKMRLIEKSPSGGVEKFIIEGSEKTTILAKSKTQTLQDED